MLVLSVIFLNIAADHRISEIPYFSAYIHEEIKQNILIQFWIIQSLYVLLVAIARKFASKVGVVDKNIVRGTTGSKAF